jgi:amino acid permease
MGKYEKYSMQSRAADSPWTIHPIWRGIGCVLIVLIPFLAYGGAVLLVQANQEQKWAPVPGQLSQAVEIPYLGSFDNLFITLLVTVVLILVGYALITVIYTLLMSVLGPPRYGEMDAPPQRRSGKRRR